MAQTQQESSNGLELKWQEKGPVSGSTVNREQGVHMDVNPVSVIRRPRENRGRMDA